MNTIKNTVAEKANRTTTLLAMERLILALGGRAAYVTWLNALPSDAELNNAGGLNQASFLAIAEDDEKYEQMVTVFARCMLPVLTELGGAQ